jgi:hypothetical protein
MSKAAAPKPMLVPQVDPLWADLDSLHEKGTAAAPSIFAAMAFSLGCVIARELRLLRAGVKP